MKEYKVGILGATGIVGQRFIDLLKNHPFFKVEVVAASSKSAGKTYGEVVNKKWRMYEKMPERIKSMTLMDAKNDLEKIAGTVDLVFSALSMPEKEIKKLETAYAKAECIVVSNNSAHRSTPDVPMVIPEINLEHFEILKYQKKRLKTKRGFIVVKPNCSIQSYVPVLNVFRPLGLKKVLVCTYQALSGAGKTFATWHEMVDNIIPYIPGEENKSEQEPLKVWGSIKNRKIVNATQPDITCQCFRVPVSNGHFAAVFASFEKQHPEIEEMIQMIENCENKIEQYQLPNSTKKFIHYFREDDRPQIKLDRDLEKGMAISVGRLREDTQYDVKFVSMSHNTVRGAAGGAVLTAEALSINGLLD